LNRTVIHGSFVKAGLLNLSDKQKYKPMGNYGNYKLNALPVLEDIPIYGKYICYPSFKPSNAVLLLAKLLLESKSWGRVRKTTTVQKSPPLSKPKLVATSNKGVS